ncbi:MAG: prefoldin subunit alpha [Thaumarchaeota archaeon]|nr:prefoldin subunit alpha [Nitrososphaerota archaeon]MCL5318981.1 prefoldin subunit alpha [Nitrososphaerota archaeon]
MSDEEKLQSMVYESRLLEGQYNELNQQQSFLLRAFAEVTAGRDALRGLGETAPTDILIPLGGGVFVKGTAPPPSQVLLGIGADIVVEKSREEALSFVEERLKEMENALAGLEARRNEIANRINAQRLAINSMVEKQSQQQQPQQ